MKRIYILLTVVLFMFFTSCTSEKPDVIIVYYKHGFVDTSIPISCSAMKKYAMSENKHTYICSDTVYVNHSDFVKIRNYMSNLKIVPLNVKTEIPRIDSRLIALYDTLAVSFGDTFIKYGANTNEQFVYSDDELVYLLKSLSGYYNYFDETDLMEFFPEIKKYGIPSTYKRVINSRTETNELVENTNPLHSRVLLFDNQTDNN